MKKLTVILIITFIILLGLTKCNDEVEVVYIKPDSVDVITHYVYETPADSVEQDTVETEYPPFLVSVDTVSNIDVDVNIEELDVPYEKNGRQYPYKITGEVWKITSEIEIYSDSSENILILNKMLLITRNSYAACSGSAKRAMENMYVILNNSFGNKTLLSPLFQEGR